MQIEIQLSEKKEGAAVVLLANLSYVQGGKTWHANVKGQGSTREDAAADLVSNRMRAPMRAALLRHLAAGDPPDPKADEPQSQPAASGEEVSSPAKSDTPQPQTDTAPQTSEPEAENSTPNKTPSESSESSETPDGTTPESQSSQTTESDDEDF